MSGEMFAIGCITVVSSCFLIGLPVTWFIDSNKRVAAEREACAKSACEDCAAAIRARGLK